MTDLAFSKVSVPTAQSCFICSCEIIPFSVNKSQRQFSEFAKTNGKVSKLFLRVACRYLNFKCGDIKPEETISVGDSNDDDDNYKHLLCQNCFPLAESLCEIFHEFKYFEQFFHWRMKEVIDLIQTQMDKFVDNNKDKNCEIPEKQKCNEIDFRRTFVKRGKENFVLNNFPKLQLARVKNLNGSESATPRFNCRFCLKPFANLHNLEAHEDTSHQGNVTLYQCEVCGNRYTKKKSLNTHMSVHSGKILQCLVCHKEFRHERNLRDHKKRNNCNRNQTKSMGNANVPGSGRTFQHAERTKGKKICRFCGKSFNVTSLKRHELIHMSMKPYRCKICGKSFRCQGNLIVHERVHSRVKPYECAICGRKFGQGSTLIKHGNNKHPGEEFDIRKRKDFSVKCRFCDKAYTNLSNKASHEKSHATTKTKPNWNYECIFCATRFKNMRDCDRHQVKCRGPNAISTENFNLPYNEAHIDAVIENVVRDEVDIQLLKVDVSENNKDMDHYEVKFILPD